MTMRTVGVEEELLLVEPGTGQPLAVAETALNAAQPEETEQTELAFELQRQQLETNTTVCRDLGELAREVRRCRSLAAEAAASAGARPFGLPADGAADGGHRHAARQRHGVFRRTAVRALSDAGGTDRRRVPAR
jgi:carboxylate-amine ligase